MEHFVEKLGGTTKCHAATSLLKKQALRHNERKECPNEKRKREFAEQSKDELGSEDGSEDAEGVTLSPEENKHKKTIVTPHASLCYSLHINLLLLLSNVLLLFSSHACRRLKISMYIVAHAC